MFVGTPIQNSLKDLWTLIKFLNVEPFQDKQWWDRTIERPVGRGDATGIKSAIRFTRSLVLHVCDFTVLCVCFTLIIIITRMWANAQPDGRPAEHRWRPLFNAAKCA